MGNVMTLIIAALVVIPAVFLLLRAIKREAVDGKCASCSEKEGCSSCGSHIVNFKE